MSRGPWTQRAKAGRTERTIREVLQLTLEDAMLCTDGHRDFQFFHVAGLKAPVTRDGEAIAVNAVVARLHVSLAIMRICGKDRRTIESWEETMGALGYVQAVDDDYVIVSLVKMGMLDRFWSCPSAVNTAIVRAYQDYRQKEAKVRER